MKTEFKTTWTTVDNFMDINLVAEFDNHDNSRTKNQAYNITFDIPQSHGGLDDILKFDRDTGKATLSGFGQYEKVYLYKLASAIKDALQDEVKNDI